MSPSAVLLGGGEGNVGGETSVMTNELVIHSPPTDRWLSLS